MSIYNIERQQRARKEHQCSGGKDCTIEPGDTYWVVAVFPGAGEYRVSADDYETLDWDFGWWKMCLDHHAQAVYGEYAPSQEELYAIIAEEEAMYAEEVAYEERARTLETAAAGAVTFGEIAG